MIAFIDGHRGLYGVEPVCRVNQISPSTYYDAKACDTDPTRRSVRCQRDAALREGIDRVWRASRRAYGARNVWKQPAR